MLAGLWDGLRALTCGARTKPTRTEDAYCQPCDTSDDAESPAGRARTRQRSMRHNSVLLDQAGLAWARYSAAPTTIHGASGFNSAGVQRIDLPDGPQSLDDVAHAVTAEALGVTALGGLHRLTTPERLARWREEFASLDLGEYSDATSAEPGSRLAALFGQLRWSVLLVEPNRFFPAHQHPDIEVEFVLGGALYENRLLLQPDRPLEASVLPDAGFPKLYKVHRHGGGSFFSNPRYSVHQSYTLDEGAAVLVLWAGRHTNLKDARRTLWDAERCSNPFCPLAGHQVHEYLESSRERQQRTATRASSGG